jgi:hypothetical protein
MKAVSLRARRAEEPIWQSSPYPRGRAWNSSGSWQRGQQQRCIESAPSRFMRMHGRTAYCSRCCRRRFCRRLTRSRGRRFQLSLTNGAKRVRKRTIGLKNAFEKYASGEPRPRGGESDVINSWTTWRCRASESTPEIDRYEMLRFLYFTSPLGDPGPNNSCKARVVAR